MHVAFYFICAFSVAAIGLACASLLNSPEERWNRESFFYNYGAFIAYLIIALIGIVTCVELYRTDYISQFSMETLLGGAAYSAGVGPLFTATYWGLTGKAAEVVMTPAPTAATTTTTAVAQRKPRREIGYGRYHT
jgi:hypothetical protein